jgi:hypothetical protein
MNHPYQRISQCIIKLCTPFRSPPPLPTLNANMRVPRPPSFYICSNLLKTSLRDARLHEMRDVCVVQSVYTSAARGTRGCGEGENQLTGDTPEIYPGKSIKFENN